MRPDPTHPLMRGLVGWWPFLAGAGGTLHDISGNGNHGTLTNMDPATDWVPGRTGHALDFDGNDDYVDLPHTVLDGLNVVTASFWIKTTKTGSQAIISGARPSHTNEYLLFFASDTTFRIYVDRNFTEYTVSSVADDMWQHWVVIRDGVNNETRLYANGVEDNESPQSLSIGALSIASGGLVIGQDQDNVGGGFDDDQALKGTLDDVRIYDRALSAAEVRQLYTDPWAPFRRNRVSRFFVGAATGAVFSAAAAVGTGRSAAMARANHLLSAVSPALVRSANTTAQVAHSGQGSPASSRSAISAKQNQIGKGTAATQARPVSVPSQSQRSSIHPIGRGGASLVPASAQLSAAAAAIGRGDAAVIARQLQTVRSTVTSHGRASLLTRQALDGRAEAIARAMGAVGTSLISALPPSVTLTVPADNRDFVIEKQRRALETPTHPRSFNVTKRSQ